MKRTKQWWAALEPGERSELVNLERADRSSRTTWPYIPSDEDRCGSCAIHHYGGGLCPLCTNHLSELIAKAEKGASK